MYLKITVQNGKENWPWLEGEDWFPNYRNWSMNINRHYKTKKKESSSKRWPLSQYLFNMFIGGNMYKTCVKIMKVNATGLKINDTGIYCH